MQKILSMKHLFYPTGQPRATMKEVCRIQEIQKRLDEIQDTGEHHGAGSDSEYIKLSNMELQLERLYDWKNEIFVENGKKGVKDIVGMVRLNPEWDNVMLPLEYFSTNSVFAVCKAGKWGLIASDGSNHIVCNPQYDAMKSAMTYRCSASYIDLFVVEKNGKKGLLKDNGEELVPCVMDKINHKGGIIALHKDRKVGMVSENVNYDVAWPEFDEIDFSCNELMIPARKGNQRGRINRTSGEFEVDGLELPILNTVETIEFEGIEIDLCIIEIRGKQEKRFRFKSTVAELLDKLKVSCYERGITEFDTFIDRFIHTNIHLADITSMPLAGHVIPQVKDIGDEINLPNTNPLYKSCLEEWIDSMSVTDFYDQIFDAEIKSLMKLPPKRRFPDLCPTIEDQEENIKFPLDVIPGWRGQTAIIRNNQWYIKEIGSIEYGGFDEIRGVFPGRLRVRKDNVWSDVDTGACGQTDDESFLDAFYHLCNFLDSLLGNTEGSYIASEIMERCRNIDMKTIEYGKPDYEIVGTINIHGLIIRKIKNTILADAVEAPEYLYVLDKPLLAIARQLRTVQLNMMWGTAFGKEICTIDNPREFLQNLKLTPRSGDVYLYGRIGRRNSSEGLADEIEMCYNELYSFNDVVIERNGRYGLRDTTGHLVLMPEYDSVTPITDHHGMPRGAIVTLNGKTAFAKRSMPMPAEEFWYDDIELFFYDVPKYIVRRKNKIGLIDVNGNLIIPCEMDEITKPQKGCSLIRKGNRWGLIIENEEVYMGDPVLVEPQFENWRCDGIFTVTKDDVEGYINEYGVFTVVAEERCELLDVIFAKR